MNLKFWKKKKTPEESDNSVADETIVATEANPTPAKPGFWTRLKRKLTPSSKKSETDEEHEAKPSARRKNDKHQDEEPEESPPKPGFLARLKSALTPTHKKGKTEDEDKPDERKPLSKRSDKNQRDEEPEPSDAPEKKSGKKLVIVLALMVPLAAGGGFFAAMKLFPPPQRQEAPLAKGATAQEDKVEGQPTEAAEQVPQPGAEQPPTDPVPQELDKTATPATEATGSPAETPVADASAPTEEDVQTQIGAMKKHNQEMQSQIEELKKQPSFERSKRSITTPRDGVLIINGKNTKESVQGLKKVIEDMNASPDAIDPGKK